MYLHRSVIIQIFRRRLRGLRVWDTCSISINEPCFSYDDNAPRFLRLPQYRYFSSPRITLISLSVCCPLQPLLLAAAAETRKTGSAWQKCTFFLKDPARGHVCWSLIVLWMPLRNSFYEYTYTYLTKSCHIHPSPSILSQQTRVSFVVYFSVVPPFS